MSSALPTELHGRMNLRRGAGEGFRGLIDEHRRQIVLPLCQQPPDYVTGRQTGQQLVRISQQSLGDVTSMTNLGSETLLGSEIMIISKMPIFSNILHMVSSGDLIIGLTKNNYSKSCCYSLFIFISLTFHSTRKMNSRDTYCW